MKICSKCKESLELNAFRKCINNKDGLYNQCRLCEKKSRNPEATTVGAYTRYPEGVCRYKAYDQANVEKRKVQHSLYYEAHKETIRAWQSAYSKTDKGKMAQTSANNKRRDAVAKANIPLKDLEVLLKKQCSQCYYCRNLLDFQVPRAVHLDHYIPITKGGTHTLDNVVWSCSSCNLKKSATIPEEAISFIDFRE